MRAPQTGTLTVTEAADDSTALWSAWEKEFPLSNDINSNSNRDKFCFLVESSPRDSLFIAKTHYCTLPKEAKLV